MECLPIFQIAIGTIYSFFVAFIVEHRQGPVCAAGLLSTGQRIYVQQCI